LKWGFSLSNWKFQDIDNTLRVIIGIQTGAGAFQSIYYQVNRAEKRVLYTFSALEQSLNATIAISGVAEISNNGINSTAGVVNTIDPSNLTDVKIIFNFPHFDALYYDPDFGVVFSGSASGSCSDGALSGAKLGVVIALSVLIPNLCCMVVVVVAAYFWIKWRKSRVVAGPNTHQVNIDSSDSSTTPTSSGSPTSSPESTSDENSDTEDAGL